MKKKINTKEGFNCICKQVILIDSVYKACIILKNYYPEVYGFVFSHNKKNMMDLIFKKVSKSIRHFFKLETLKFAP